MSLLPGFDAVELMERKTGKKLQDTFVFPPFSVLNAREGYWQDRKRAWLAMGLQSEIGRGGARVNVIANPTNKENIPGYYRKRDAGMSDDEIIAEYESGLLTSGTSIFDPVLCELAYRWFCPPSGQVLDPFAGGSVRGIVAAKLGRRYWGCDLRQEQIDANNQQADAICDENRPTWVCGDSRQTMATAPQADFVFSCPPYGSLERYSDDPADLSVMDWQGFLAAYRAIVAASCAKLRQDRFACFVVGNFRDKRGMYCDLVGETVRAFEAAGLGFYNDAVLITAVGSLPIRITKQFEAGRKLGKTHQNVLVFVKDDAKRASLACKS